jgi:TM2 domain-containing membrane protein YozV
MKPFPLPKIDRNPAAAAILSGLCIGLGQAYNGEIAKAAIFLFLYAASTFLTFFIIGFVTTPILWIWSIVDAYRSSQKMNQAGAAGQSPFKASPPGVTGSVPVKGLEKDPWGFILDNFPKSSVFRF